MDWFRNLSPRGKRVAIVGAGVALALVLVLASRRRAPASAAATDPAAPAPVASAGPGFEPANVPYDAASSGILSDLVDDVADLRRSVEGIPVPEVPAGASEIAQDVAAILAPVFNPAGPAPVTTTPPVTAAPVVPAPTRGGSAPARGPVGGRRVGPWDTAAKRDKAVAGIPKAKVRPYSDGGKFFAEIFD